MFEKLIENLLQSILGEYVEGLDQQSLKVGIWSGEAKVENLRLKPDALLKLDLPFLVKFSKLGTLNMNIPWKNLASAPLRANLDTLYLILTPQQQSDWKFGAVTAADKLLEMDAFKIKLLNRLINQEQADGMMQRIVIRVIENLQIRIQNIHIRIEDAHFNYGFVLQNFNLLTVNEQGVEQFIDRTTNKNQYLIKCLSISNIGLYWQWKGQQAYDEEKLSQEIPSSDYIFRLTLKSKVVQPPKSNALQEPDYSFNVDLQQLDIAFSKPQVQQILNVVDFMNLHNRSKLQFQKQQQITQPLDEQDQVKIRQILSSVQLDKKFKDGLSKTQIQELSEILNKTQIEEVKLIILEIVKEQQYEEMKQKALKKKQPQQGFLAGWFGRGKQQQQQYETPTLLPEEKDEITNFLEQNFQPEDQGQKITTIKVEGLMQQGTITLSNPRLKATDEIKIQFQDLRCQLKMDKDLKLNVSLIDMLILFNQQEFLTNTSNDNKQPFFCLDFNILESVNTQVELTTRSSTLKFHPDIITVLSDFGDVEMQSDQIKNMADDRIQELKQNAQVVLANKVVAESQRWVNITMNQLYIELPINNKESWIFCPGLVRINSSIVSAQEKYTIELSRISLRHLSTIEYSVVDNFTISLDILLPSQIQKNLSINANIQDIITNLNPTIYQKLTQLGDCFTPSISAEEYKKQVKVIAKSKLMENAIKVGPLFIKEGQLNQWVKHTCMISGSYLYCYATPKSQEPTHIKWIKNSEIVVKGVDEYNMNILIIQNENNQFEVGIQNQAHIKDWVDKIHSLKDQEQFLLEQIGETKQKAQTIEFEKFITFTIDKVQINLQDSNSRQFLVAKTNNLSLKMKIDPKFIILQLTLQGLSIQDSLRQYIDPKMQNLITSEESLKELIEINYSQIDRTSETYKDIDTQIELKFGNLHMNFKSETFAYLMQFLNLEQSDEKIQQKLDQEEVFLEAEKRYLLLKLSVQIQTISFSIIHEISKLPFAQIKFEKSDIQMQKYQDELQIQVSLGNLQVNDLTNHPYTLTKEEDYLKIRPNQIIGIKELNQSLLQVNIIIVEPLSRRAALDRNLIQVNAKISQIVADYQQQPVLRIIDYIQNIQEPFLNANSFKSNGFIINSDNHGNKAAPSKIRIDPLKNEAEKIISDPPRMKIDVQINNPQIIIRNKFENQQMTINLGQISVSNDKKVINNFFKDFYYIEIKQLSIEGESENKKSTIASEFDLALEVMLPDLIPHYKALAMKPDETMYINAEMSPFILNIDQKAMKLINRLVAYNFTLNDSFDEYILLNAEKSNQITQEEQKIIIKQDVEKKTRSSEYFLKFKLHIVNISIFLSIERPLIRLSIVDSQIGFNMKKDDKKELEVNISSFNACVYEQVNGYYVSKPLIGVQKETKFERLNNFKILIAEIQHSNKESGKIEMFINPTATKTHNKLYLTFERFLLTIQTKVLLQALTIFEAEQLTPYVNNELIVYQNKYQEMIRSQSKEDESQPKDSQIFIKLEGVTIAIPSTDNSMLTLTGKFNVIINTYDTMNLDELLSIIKQKGLNEFDLIGMNYKMKTTVSIEQVQAYLTSKEQLYTCDFNELEKRQLIWPFTMLINQAQQLVISENFDSLVEKQEIRISLSKFQFRIAFLDILYIQKQIEAQLEIVNQIANNDIKKQQQETQGQQNGEIKLELVIDGIEVIILNDLENYYQYILTFRLYQSEIKFEQNLQKKKLNTTLPLALQYFNQNIGIWEPLIEKCDITVTQTNDDFGEHNLLIQLQNVVNVNISTQMVSTVYSAITILMQQLQAKNNKQISCANQSYAKYAICNQLGQDVLCETNDKQIIIAQFNEYKPFDIQSNKSNNYVQLQIQGDRFPYEVRNWNIDKLQSKIQKTGDNSQILIQNFVDPTKNQRVICVSSEFMILNNTQTHLDIVFKDKKDNKYEFKLQAFLEKQNKVTCLPNQLIIPQNLLNFEFCLRKSQNPEEKSQFYNFQYMRQCYNSHESVKLWLNKNFIVILSICKDPNFNGRLGIYIQPNFRLQNLLPFPIKLSVLYESSEGETHNLQSLQFLDEHLLQNIKQSHAIRVDIDAYKPSQPIPLLNSRTFKSQQNLINLKGEEWQGCQGGKSTLILEYNYQQFEQSGLCSAALYCKEYITNETEYEYIVYQGKDTQYELIGGQRSGSKSRPLILNDSNQQNELVFASRDTPKVLSLNSAYINSIGTSVGDIIYRKADVYYIVPLAVTSEIKLIHQTYQKLVTVKNRIILVNNCEYSACIKQFYTAQEIKPHERKPLEICYGDKVPSTSDKVYLFQMTLLEGYNWNWSGTVECNQVGVFYLQLRSQKFAGIRKFIQIDINESNGILFVVISETKPDQSPYRISNFSQLADITILNIPAELEYKQECFFAFDDPSLKKEVEVHIRPKNKQLEILEYQLSIEKITEGRFFVVRSKNKSENSRIYLKLVINMEGYTRHAKFYDSNEEELQGYKDQNLNKGQQDQPQFKFDVMLNQIHLNLIDNHQPYPLEICNIVLHQCEAIMIIKKSNKAVFQFKIQGLQIDNASQLYPQFPVVLTLLPRGKTQMMPLINILAQMNFQAKQVQQIDKFSVELNCLAVKINDVFIKFILQTVNKITEIIETQQLKIQPKFDWKKCDLPEKLIPTYIGQLTIYPIILEITVQWGKKDKDKDSDSTQVTSLLSGLGFQLVSVDEAEIKLKGINIEDVFDSFSGLSKRLKSIYMPNIYQQLPAILGSLAAIGNPTKLLKNFVSGMQDLVERPIEGFTKGPLEGGMGMISGAGSLVSHTVSGVFNSVKNVVGTISSGLTKVTMDENYQQQREIQNQQQAKNVGSGLAEGSVSLAKGVAGGVFGFFSKPIQGAQQDGASGFVKGLWQGTSGLIIKPVTGVLDVISKTSEGVKNQLSAEEQPNNQRIRYLRCFYESDGYYKDYNWIDGESYEVIKGIKKGQLSHHRMVRVVSIERDKKIFSLILTDQSVILYDQNKHLKLWCLLYRDIESINYTGDVIQIKNKKSKKAFQGNSITFLNLPSQQHCQQLTEEIKQMQQSL